ncbi:hypothetical protein CYMTET_32433, partial [Cymbomonas tetramitiformis]
AEQALEVAAARDLTTTEELRRQAHSDSVELKEQLWARDAELAATREKMAGLKKALDERRSDLMRYKEQLAASLERERDAQRQLVQLRLRSESDLDEQTASAAVENEKLIKSLTEQRDSTVALLKVRRFGSRVGS